MDALTQIREKINDFPGYGSEADIGRADAEIRAYVGERLAALQECLGSSDPQAADALEPLIVRTAFANLRVIAPLEQPGEALTSNELLQCDLELLDLADDAAGATPATLDGFVQKLTTAFDQRDASLVRAGIALG